MSTITRNLTFKSSNLGENVTLMLCFTPPSSGLYKTHFPMAWKVTTLGATGGSTMNATWAADLSFCVAQVGQGQLVTAGNYTSISPGERSTLNLDTSMDPPVYQWSSPAKVGGNAVQAKNGTNGPTAIGVGFITGKGGDHEDMSPALVWPSVGSGMGVTAEFTPVLSAYVALNFKRNQIVTGEVQSVDPIWRANLISLGVDSTIRVVKTPGGGYKGELVQFSRNIDDEIPPVIDLFDGVTRLYYATLSFSTSSMVKETLKAMTQHLLSKGYRVKVVFEGQSTEARVELILPPNTSCNQAEHEVMGGIHVHQFPPAAAIKERGGEVMLYSGGNMSFWNDINPAKQDWYTGKSLKNTELFEAPETYIAHVTNGVEKVDIGNGNANDEFAVGLRTPMPTLSRKSSVASFM